MADLINFNADFVYSTELFALDAIFLFIQILFLKNTRILGGVLSVPHLMDIYAKSAGERGRTFMCKRTLPSLLVSFMGCYGISYVNFSKNIDPRLASIISIHVWRQVFP